MEQETTSTTNKTSTAEYYKEYRENNRDKFKKNCKTYYDKNKAKVRRCEVCNCDIKGINVSQHNRTNKHLHNLYVARPFILIRAPDRHN